MPKRSTSRTPTPKAKAKASPANDPRTKSGACVKVPSGDRAYVEGIDPKDSGRVLIRYEAGLGDDSYPLHMLTLVHESPESETARAFQSGDQVEIIQTSEITKNFLGKIGVVRQAGSLKALVELENGKSATFRHGWLKLAKSELAISQSPLDQLAAQINALHSDVEAAREVAKSAEESALQHAMKAGELLLQAKKEAGHGNWEKWRSENLSLPSSTATLYQRCYERKAELEGISTLKEAQALLKKERGRAKELAAAPTGTETKSATVADLPQGFEQSYLEEAEQIAALDSKPVSGINLFQGDRVRILADDDFYQQTALVDRIFEADGQEWAGVYCSLLPGQRLDYLTSDLSFVAGSSADLLAELRILKIPPVELSPQPEAVDPQPVVEPLQLQISPEQRAAEKLLVEYKVPIAAVAKKLLGWCNERELEEIGEWLLDEKARRKGYADYDEFADAVTAQFFEKEAS